MPTPYTRLKTSQLSSLLSTTLGALKPYQVNQVVEYLSKVKWGPQGSQSSVAAQPTISTIVTAQGANNA